MKNLFFLPTLLTACLFFFSALPASAQTETDFRISVISGDGKFIGTSMGGAQIVVSDRRTGDILIQGVTHGVTDGTEALMADSRDRDAVLVDDDTASFQFSIELVEPTPVTIAATAPLVRGQNAVTASRDMLLIPGKDYSSGNGIMLELPGIVVDIVSPPLQSGRAFDAEQPVRVVANILKLCGCQVAEDSPWPPERYEVEARIYRGALFIDAAQLGYAGLPGMFGADLNISRPGTYRIEVTAFDPLTREAGMDTTTVTLTQE